MLSKKQVLFEAKKTYTKAEELYEITKDEGLLYCMYALEPYVKDTFLQNDLGLMYVLTLELKDEIKKSKKLK